jgi:hypothetical protein
MEASPFLPQHRAGIHWEGMKAIEETRMRRHGTWYGPGFYHLCGAGALQSLTLSPNHFTILPLSSYRSSQSIRVSLKGLRVNNHTTINRELNIHPQAIIHMLGKGCFLH